MFNVILEWFLRNINTLCDFQLSIAAKFFICSLMTLLVYSLGMITVKILIWIRQIKTDEIFEELYVAVLQNNTIKAICILNSYPQYINKYNPSTGYTPFMIACVKVNTQLVTYMLQKGADPNLKSKFKETPLYLASFYYIQHRNWKNATCIRELYYAGANINEPGRNQITIIQLAAIFGHTSLVKWLLVKNVNLNVCPHPYLLAQSQGHHNTANLIATNVKIKSLPY